MARFEINPGLDGFVHELSCFGADEPEIAKEIVIAGAQPVADELRNRINKLPIDRFRMLKDNEQFEVLTKEQKEDLLNGFGITPPGVDNNGNTNIKVGFKGYGRYKTHKYPKGIPNVLLARAIESGSSVRKKVPFVRPATNRTRRIAIDKMQDKFNEKVKGYQL